MSGSVIKRINYVTNIPSDVTSGGWTGINAEVYQNLATRFETRYVGPINPGINAGAKLISKLNRLSGRKGAYFFFSQSRLQAIASLLEEQMDKQADFDFFHGITPWIGYKSPRPYCFYTDACFSNYMDVYHVRSQFSGLERICEEEANWIKGAHRAFFGTQWALEQTLEAYSIPRGNLEVVGLGGHIPIPQIDEYQGGYEFLFVSLDFERKGGHLCIEAFQRVRNQFPDARLTLLGTEPPQSILSVPGVVYEGYLRKTVPQELRKLQQIFARAFALIHPTSTDIAPLVIVEAGYFGCPAIASRSFSIPELVIDGITGYLVTPPLHAEDFAERMIMMCSSPTSYKTMRQEVRSYTTQKLVWSNVAERMKKSMVS